MAIEAKGRRPSNGVRERSQRVIRLKEELNLILELVVHSRESLENELDSDFAKKKLSIDTTFLKKLKELTACYNALTDSRIRLDKSEQSLEREMTPAEEKAAVTDFVKSWDNKERGEWLRDMVKYHISQLNPQGSRTDWSDIGLDARGNEIDASRD